VTLRKSGFRQQTPQEVKDKQVRKMEKALLKAKNAPKVKSKTPTGKKPRKQKTAVQKLRDKADKMLTPIIKVLYPVCLFNGYDKCTYDTQVAHHHIKKSTSSALRYYVPNLIGLCTVCHCRLHNDEILWTGRVIVIMGMEWLADLEEVKKQEVRTNKQFYEDHIDNLSTYKQI